MHTIFQQLVYAREKGRDTVLATIIWDDGSAPRGRGSQMLVDGDGLLAGTIGGGAVEGPSIEIAREMLRDGKNGYTHFFRLQKDGEVGMVCGGADMQQFDKLGCGALADTAGCEVLVMDELGPHEEQAAAFRQAVLRALEGDVPVVGVLQQAESAFLRQVASHPNVRVVTVTEENRDALRLYLAQRK